MFHCSLSTIYPFTYQSQLRKHHQINDGLFSKLMKAPTFLEYLCALVFGKTMRLRPELNSWHFRDVEL